MNNQKCSNCGLVNFANVEVCRRCQSPFSANPSTQNFSSHSATATFDQPRVSEYADTTPDNTHLKRFIFGLLWFAGGSLVSYFSYNSAEGGGSYYVFYGAIIFGLIDMIRGIAGMLTDN